MNRRSFLKMVGLAVVAPSLPVAAGGPVGMVKVQRIRNIHCAYEPLVGLPFDWTKDALMADMNRECFMLMSEDMHDAMVTGFPYSPRQHLSDEYGERYHPGDGQ